MKEYFDLNDNKVNGEMELSSEPQYPTKHFTKEIISQFFERERELRSLSGEDRDSYIKEYKEELDTYISLDEENFLFEENGKWGVRNNVLDVVMIAPQYDEVSVLYSWSKVRLGDKYGLVFPNKNGGEIICPPIYDDIMSMDDYFGEDINWIGVIIKKNGKYGLSYGYQIDLEPIYDRITLVCGKRAVFSFLLEKNGKYGLLLGSTLIPAQYDEIQVPSLMGWIKARKGDVWGYFDVDCNFTEDISKAFLLHFSYNWCCQTYEQNYLNELFNDYSCLLESVINCTMTNEKWEYIESVESEKPFERKVLYAKYNSENLSKKIGLRLYITAMDLIPPIYDELQYMSDNIYCYRLNRKYGFVLANGKGTELCPPLYDEVKKVKDFNLLLVRIKQKWGIIRINEKDYPTELNYDEIIERERDLGIEFLIKKGDKLGVFIDGDIVPPIYDGIFVPEVFGWIRVCKDGEWGYLDVNNEFTSDISEAYLCYVLGMVRNLNIY